jgi:hypothetical protein
MKIYLTISVAGRIFREEFSNATNQSSTFIWDGKDAYGRVLQGKQPISVAIGYAYSAFYANIGGFGFTLGVGGGIGLITGSRSRQEIALWKSFNGSASWKGYIGTYDRLSQGMGGLASERGSHL